jgi:hypothetical protein
MEYISTISISISSLAAIAAFQIWLYRYAYHCGYEIGKHCGFTGGLYQGKIRENHRLTEQANKSKVSTSCKKTLKPSLPNSSSKHLSIH